MAEYIDRDIAIAKMTELFAEFPNEIGHYLQGRCIGVLLFEQAEDVVEAVRCKDCVHCVVREYDIIDELECEIFDVFTDPIDYCSRGERKVDNG